MQASHSLDRAAVTFDDSHSVCDAGGQYHCPPAGAVRYLVKGDASIDLLIAVFEVAAEGGWTIETRSQAQTSSW